MIILHNSDCVGAEASTHIRESMPCAEDISGVADLLKACGDVTRAGIICALLQMELCVCDLAEVLGMTSSAISHQLRVLKNMGIVKTRRSGKSMFYSLSDGHIEQIFNTAFEHVREGVKQNAR